MTQAVPLPGEAAIDCPPENPASLFAQLLQKVRVPLRFGDAHVEGHESNTVPNRLARCAYHGGVVGCHPEVELRNELEPLVMQKAGYELIATRKLLHACLRQSNALSSLGCRDEATPFRRATSFGMASRRLISSVSVGV